MTRRAAVGPAAPASAERDALYGLSLSDFVGARDALAVRLAKEGQRDQADAVRRLRKPTPAVWAINQAVRQAPHAAEQLLTAVSALRKAPGRSGEALAEATAGQREALDRLVALARAKLREAGVRDTADVMARVRGTLSGAAADGRRHDELRGGRLTAELRAPEFDVLFAGGARARGRTAGEEPAAPPRRAGPPVAARREAERERRERAEEALRVARSAAEDWRQRTRALEQAARDRRREAEAVRAALEERRRELRAAQERLAGEERGAEAADREAERARREAERAEARASAAERALARGRDRASRAG